MSTLDWLHSRPEVKEAVLGMLERCMATMKVLDAHVVWHDTMLPQQPLQGRQAAAAVFRLLRTALPDLQLTVEEVVSAENDHMLLYYAATGTHLGPLVTSLQIHCSPAPEQQHEQRGIAPTGNAVSWTGSMVLRCCPSAAPSSCGTDVSMQVVEAWHSWDPLFLYQQIGLTPVGHIPAPPPAAPAAQGTALAGTLDATSLAAASSQEEEQLQQQAVDASWTEACKAVVQQYFDIYNTGEFSRLPSIVHATHHYWGLIDLEGKQGVAGMQAMMSGWRDALAGFCIGNDWLIAAEGHRVVFRWVLKGTHTKSPLRGVAALAPAPGCPPRHICSCGVTALSLKQSPHDVPSDGSTERPWKIWRKVSHANAAELLRQLGVFEFHVSA